MLEDFYNKVEIRRVYLETETLGSWYLNNVVLCKTMELPWNENKRSISCIPEGFYEVRKELTSGKHKYPHFRIYDVPGRSGILVHKITYVKDLRGCIGVGKAFADLNRDGVPDMIQSGIALQELYDTMPNLFQLTIKKKMKKILLLILLLPSILLAQNRVLTAIDTAKYHAKIGDLLIDTPTTLRADGINTMSYRTISKTFPTMREGATIWVDGTKLGPVCEFRLLNVTATTPWHIQKATIKPLPGTRVDGIYTANSYGGFLYLVQGLKYLSMEGSSVGYSGLTNLEKGDFLKGRFGFSGTSNGYYSGYHVYSISVLCGGEFYFEGFEGEHGFSVLRFQGGDYDCSVKLKVRNAYIHDSESEAFYIGATHGPPYAKIENDIKDVIIARAGTEALQLQHVVGKSWIRNITIFSPSCAYLNAFQPFQDTGMQLSSDEGNITLEKIVVDSWGSHALNLFGSDYTSTTKNTTIKNILMNNGRGEAVYFHPSCKYGMVWNLDSLYIRNPNREYYIDNKTPPPSWIISRMNGTDLYKVANDLYQNLPDVEYVNSGFYEPAHKIKFYSRYYGKYLTGVDTLAVPYKSGEVIEDREPLKTPVWCKVITDFKASAVRPKNNKNCIVLTWDNKGVRSDQIGWNRLGIQKPYPPDDLRVKHDNFYGLKNIGYVEKAPTLLQELNLAKKEILQLTAQRDSINSLLNDSNALLASSKLTNTQLTTDINALRAKITGMYLEMFTTLEKYK